MIADQIDFSVMFEQTLSIIIAARTELIQFCFAFAIHHFIFGHGAVSRGSGKGKQVGKHLSKFPASRSDSGASRRRLCEASFEQGAAVKNSRSAYDRGDHRGVLSGWETLKKAGKVPASHLAQVVECMQRLMWDSSSILAEVLDYLQLDYDAHNMGYVNELLELLAKSLDTIVVDGIVKGLPELALAANSGSYETLIQMHFSTRSLAAVAVLAQSMRTAGFAASARVTVILFKTALQVSDLDEAIRCYKDLISRSAAQSGGSSATASVAPCHLLVQLVELACRAGRAEAVLAELAGESLHLTTDMVNVMLGEGLRGRDGSLVAHIERLAALRAVPKNGRTFQLLIRHAGSDLARVEALLEELEVAKADCSLDLVAAALAACAQSQSGGARMAERLERLLVVQAEGSGRTQCFLALIRFYSEAGEHGRACAAYDEHVAAAGASPSASPAAASPAAAALGSPKRGLLDLRTERCLVSSALKCGRGELAAQLLQGMPADTPKHLVLLRHAAARGDLPEVMRIFGALRASGAELAPSIWNSTLDACVECRDLRRAEQLMEEMQGNRVADVVSYNTLIKAHLRQDNVPRARSLMETMKKSGCTPNSVTYNELIHSLVQGHNDSRRAQVWQVVDEMKREGVRPNRVTCSILLKSLKAKSPPADVQRTMELTEAMDEPLDEVLLSSIVEACVRVGKPQVLAQKLHELEHAHSISITGVHTYGSLIKAYGYVKNIKGAWRCWKEMRSQHLTPTSITIGCMVEAVVMNGDVDGGHELVAGLLEDELCKHQVNAVVFGSVLKGYSRARRMERVWSVFEDMLTRGIQPSVVTFNAVIDGCARNHQMHRVQGLLEHMSTLGMQPNLITFSTMIKGWCSCGGDFSAALATLEALRKTPGLKPDEIVYNTLLDGCAQVGLVSEGERLYKEMQDEGIAPSCYTLSVLVRLLGQARLQDRAFELVSVACSRHRLRPNAALYAALVQTAVHGKDLARAVSVYDQAAWERCVPDGKACAMLVRALLATGSHAKAVSILRSTLGLNRQQNRKFEPRDSYGSGNSSAAGIDDTFISEVICSILAGAASGVGGALAASLLADAKAARPRLRLDAGLERKVTLAVAAAAAH